LSLALATALLAPVAAHGATSPTASRADALLTLEHPAGLSSFVRAVSDPASPRYRHYLSVERLVKRYGARRSARTATVSYLRGRGLRATVGAMGTYVLASGSRAAMGRALPTAGAQTAGAGGARSLTVPAALRAVVTDAVRLGTTHATPATSAARATPTAKAAADDDPYNGLSPQRGSAAQRSGTPAGCPEGVGAQTEGLFGFTPNQYLGAYGLDVLHRAGLRGQRMRVALVETGGFQRSDIATFARCFGAELPTIRFTNVSGRGALAPLDETTLDIEVMVAALPRLTRMDVYGAQRPDASAESDFLAAASAAVGARGQHPDVISISYGLCEPLLALRQGGSIGRSRALDQVFQLAAASGITVTASSGDYGYSSCTQQIPTTIPNVEVPAALPHVTGVGGTNLQLAADNHALAEVVWNDAPLGVPFGGGGGRSVIFERPWWQKAPGTGGTARQVPDVAALADRFPGYAIYCTTACASAQQPQGGWTTVGGTSAATPLVASGTVLADQAARRAGQRNLGFLNPLLYGLARGDNPGFVLRDVTIGSNDTAAAIAGGGQPFGLYDARKGYDMASGLGAPKFAALSSLALRAAAATPRRR
jgi:subtilase family serine protease